MRVLFAAHKLADALAESKRRRLERKPDANQRAFAGRTVDHQVGADRGCPLAHGGQAQVARV